MYVTLGIQGFTLMLPFVYTVDPNETIYFAFSVDKSGAECT